MRSMTLAILLANLPLLSPVLAAPAPAGERSSVSRSGPLLDSLITLNRAYIAAARAGDVATMQSMVTDDYVGVDPYYAYMLVGPGAVAAEQKAWAAYFKPASGDEVFYRKESDPVVKDLGDVAILIYVELEAVKTRGDRVRGGRAGKCSFVYRKTPTGWKLANSIITEQPWPDRMIAGSRK